MVRASWGLAPEAFFVFVRLRTKKLRREEVAALRWQLNAARLIESNPTLMRLRELEVLEKVTEKAKLSVVLGDGGLAEKMVKLL
jgi:hypothetical protein